MSLTPSSMLPLGTIAPAFKLVDTISQREMSLQELASPVATVIMFICNHCPYVKHLQAGLLQFIKDYQVKGIDFIAINSNDIARYPEDAPDKMHELALHLGFTFPYLFDETQEIAKAYRAECTPDFYIFDKGLACVYRGQFDDSRPGNDVPVTGASMRAALDSLLAGQAVSREQKPSVGCNIKWKSFDR